MINVYLSNDGSTWIDKYPSTSPYANQPLSSYVEDRGLNIYAQVAFANSSPTKLTINVSGYSSCLAPFKEYKYIKITEDSTVQFIGTQASSTETVDSQVTRTLSIIYDDLSSTWKDLTFGDIESLAVTTGVVMPCSDPNIDWDANQSKLVIQKYIDELASHISKASANASLESQLINEKIYWTNVLRSYNGQGGIAKHELKKTTTDNIKVCDNTDKQHSMVHILFALLTNIPVNTTYQDTTIVRFFYAMDEDNVLDTVCEFLAQNGLGWFIDYPNNQIKVVSYDASSTATAVQYVETKAQIRTDPTKIASANEQQNAQFIANLQTEIGVPICKMFDTKKDYNKLVMVSPWSYSDTFKYDGIGVCYPPAEDRRYLYNGTEYNANIPQVGSIEPDKDVRVIKKKYFWEKRPTNSVYDKSSKSWRQYPYLFGVEGGDYFLSNPYFEMRPFMPSVLDIYDANNARGQILVLYIDNDGTIKYAFASNKTGVHWNPLNNGESRQKSGFNYLRVFANVTKAIWSSVNHADSYTGLKSSNDDVIKLQYIFTVKGMERFRKASYWYRISDAQSWTFNSPTRYEVMQALQISGIDNTYVLVTKREKDLATGTYKYTCVKAPTTEFAYNGQGIITNIDIPFDPTAFDFNVNRVLAVDANGIPKDATPIRVSVNQVYDYPTVTLEYNGNSYQAINEDGKIAFDIPVMDIAEGYTGSIKNTYNDFETEKTFKIDVISDGENGEDGATPDVRYALSENNTSHPTDGYFVFGDDTYLVFNDQDLVYEIYQMGVVQSRGTYVWMKTENTDGSLTYACMSGVNGRNGQDGKSVGEFLGVKSSIPTTGKTDDVFLLTTTSGSAMPYVYRNGWQIVDLSDPSQASSAMLAFNGALASGEEISKLNNPLWILCQNLVSQNAVVDNLVAKKIKVTDSLESSSYVVNSLYGESYKTATFIVKHTDYGEPDYIGFNVWGIQRGDLVKLSVAKVESGSEGDYGPVPSTDVTFIADDMYTGNTSSSYYSKSLINGVEYVRGTTPSVDDFFGLKVDITGDAYIICEVYHTIGA